MRRTGSHTTRCHAAPQYDPPVREGREAVRRSGTKREGGASLVEFAFVLPLLALFLFGIVQFGIAYDMKQSINSAAREGARTAAIPDDGTVTYNTVVARVNDSFDSLGSDTVDSVTIEIIEPATSAVIRTVSPGDPNSPCKTAAGKTVRVTVVNEFVATIPFFGTIEPDLTGTGEFRCEIDA
jgi:Flp pilus assembly protein TadG